VAQKHVTTCVLDTYQPTHALKRELYSVTFYNVLWKEIFPWHDIMFCEKNCSMSFHC